MQIVNRIEILLWLFVAVMGALMIARTIQQRSITKLETAARAYIAQLMKGGN